MPKLDYRLVLPGLCIVATSYGLARYAYGLFLPMFRASFGLSDQVLAFIAACSYASYFVITVAGIALSKNLQPRMSVLLGGLCATIGMALIAMADAPWMLVLGVALAGVSPGLAYTPFSEIIVTLVRQPRQSRVYSIINSGTALGVMLSGPLAIWFGESWRAAWAAFAVFGLVSTLWCVVILPRIENRVAGSLPRMRWREMIAGDRSRLFVVAFALGIAASIFWAFSVDLAQTNSPEGLSIFGWHLDRVAFSQVFWTFVGLSSFAGVFAGAIAGRLGTIRAMALFVTGNAAALAMIALGNSPLMIVLAGLLFGAVSCLYCAALGIWSLELFPNRPTVGFGTAFLLLSVGQFVGPVLVGLAIGYVDLATLFLVGALLSLAIIGLLPRKPMARGIPAAAPSQ